MLDKSPSPAFITVLMPFLTSSLSSISSKSPHFSDLSLHFHHVSLIILMLPAINHSRISDSDLQHASTSHPPFFSSKKSDGGNAFDGNVSTYWISKCDSIPGSLAPIIWGDGLHFDGCEPEQVGGLEFIPVDWLKKIQQMGKFRQRKMAGTETNCGSEHGPTKTISSLLNLPFWGYRLFLGWFRRGALKI